MGMAHPDRALAAVRRALVPKGVLVAALWGERERLPWWLLPREVTGRYVELPPVDPAGPSPFRFGTAEVIERDFTKAGFTVAHLEEMDIPVVEAEAGAGIVEWVRAVFGRWIAGLPADKVPAWEADLARDSEAFRTDGMIRVGGVTRIVVARVSEIDNPGGGADGRVDA